MIVWSERIFFALAGALIAWFLQQYRVRRTEETSIINDHIKDIDNFSEAAIAYWLAKPRNAEEDRALSVKVHAKLTLATRVYPQVQTAVGNDDVTYKNLVFELFKVATDAPFESAKRAADPQRALDISYVASGLISHLRGRRQHILTISHLVDSARRYPYRTVLQRNFFKLRCWVKNSISWLKLRISNR